MIFCIYFWGLLKTWDIFVWGTVNKTYYLYLCTVNRIEISKLNSRFYQVCKWTIQMWTGSLDSLIICDSKESFVHKFISLLLWYNCSKKSWNTQYDFFLFSFFEAWKPQSSFIWFILKLNGQVILQKFSFVFHGIFWIFIQLSPFVKKKKKKVFFGTVWCWSGYNCSQNNCLLYKYNFFPGLN